MQITLPLLIVITLLAIWVATVVLTLSIRTIVRWRAGLSPEELKNHWPQTPSTFSNRWRIFVVEPLPYVIQIISATILMFILPPMLILLVGITLNAPPVVTVVGVVIGAIGIVIWQILRPPPFLKQFWGTSTEQEEKPFLPLGPPALNDEQPYPLQFVRPQGDDSDLFAEQSKPFVLWAECRTPQNYAWVAGIANAGELTALFSGAIDLDLVEGHFYLGVRWELIPD